MRHGGLPPAARCRTLHSYFRPLFRRPLPLAALGLARAPRRSLLRPPAYSGSPWPQPPSQVPRALCPAVSRQQLAALSGAARRPCPCLPAGSEGRRAKTQQPRARTSVARSRLRRLLLSSSADNGFLSSDPTVCGAAESGGPLPPGTTARKYGRKTRPSAVRANPPERKV